MATTVEQEAHAFALVGEFMWHWNYIESCIVDLIQHLLKMPHPQGEIILANVTFRDKTSMAQTLCHYALEFNGRVEKAKSVSKLFRDINNFNSDYRNVLVHNTFHPREEGGIDILRVRAKGKFEMPDTYWSSHFFKQRFQDIDKLDSRLEQLRNDLEGCLFPNELINAFVQRTQTEPTGMTAGQGPTPPQDPPLGDSTDFPPQSTTPGKDS